METSKVEESAYVDSGSLLEGTPDNLIAMEGEVAVRSGACSKERFVGLRKYDMRCNKKRLLAEN